MTIPTVDGWDATHNNLGAAPKVGQGAGYITGSTSVQWTAADKAAHPGFVQIDQTPVISTAAILADFYDVETGAITLAEIAHIVTMGQSAFKAVTRPGQRWPGVYCSRNSVTGVVNALLAGGVKTCPLGVAQFDNDHGKAVNEVANATGPFPIVWRQYADRGSFDLDVFSVPWLTNVAKKDPTPITQNGWNWCFKCEGLFYGPHQSTSNCPAGSTHDGSRSGNYSLIDTP